MTRTSRHVPEPPRLDPLPDHHGDPMDAPRHGYAPVVGLAIFIASAALVIGGLVLAVRNTQTSDPVALAAPAGTDIACRAPARPGEQLAVFFRHERDRVVFRCISSRDWDVMPRSLPPEPKDWRPM